MAQDIESGLFEKDDLLARVQADLDAFYWQSHTFSHLARDNLGLNDCRTEDAGESRQDATRMFSPGLSCPTSRSQVISRWVAGLGPKTFSQRIAHVSIGPPCPLALHSKFFSGNTQMAILLDLYDSNNYCWRSMTSPGITGLFNPFCLQAGDENLMKCYPGDNTYTLANTNPATVSLINEDNQFHSLTTTTATNGET